jgi:hypothetical protein
MARVAVLALAAVLTPLLAWGEGPDVSGTWSGTWHEGGAGGALVLRLVHDGDVVRGRYDADGSGKHGSNQRTLLGQVGPEGVPRDAHPAIARRSLTADG